MGVCLSCLGLNRSSSSTSQDDRARLLYDEYGHPVSYGTWGSHTSIPPQNLLTPEEARREQEAWEYITRMASDQIVEIFPYRQQNGLGLAVNGHGLANGQSDAGSVDGHDVTAQAQGQGHMDQHHDLMMSLIPGDKSKRSIRIYPSSRPTSREARSVKAKESSSRLDASGLDGTREKVHAVFTTLMVDLP